MKNSKYEKLYSNNKNFFGKKPSLLILNHHYLFPKNASFLDLGCGQGQDLLFMSQIGYKCLGIDNSSTAIKQIQAIIKKRKLVKVSTSCIDILNFDFSKKSYGIINLRNVLHYLNKKESREIIKSVKTCVTKNGFIIISTFTNEDPSYFIKKTGFKSYFKKNELLGYFKSKFNIIYYFEGLIKDKKHGNYPSHQHGIAMIIAQKK